MESRHVIGYALCFDSVSEHLGGGLYEVIRPSAMNGVLVCSDILALIDHDPRRGVLARAKNGVGSLSLTVDKVGLRYEFTAPDTQLGTELVSNLKRGEISASSFGFFVAKNGESYTKRSDGSVLRTISQFAEIVDVSPCVRPAYSKTSCGLKK